MKKYIILCLIFILTCSMYSKDICISFDGSKQIEIWEELIDFSHDYKKLLKEERIRKHLRFNKITHCIGKDTPMVLDNRSDLSYVRSFYRPSNMITQGIQVFGQMSIYNALWTI